MRTLAAHFYRLLGQHFQRASHGIEPDAVTREVMAMVSARFPDHFGDLEPFGWGVTRADALEFVERVRGAKIRREVKRRVKV